MSRWLRITIGSVLALAALLATGVLTRWEYTAEPADRAEVRLAWRARVPPVEECRRLSEEEQAELPIHMRREVVCEGRVASYRLEVAVDGRTIHSATVEGAGARGDRPLYVFDAIPVEPGSRRLRVVFERLRSEEGRGEAGPGAEDPGRAGPPQVGRGAADAVPERLVLDEEVTLGGREVVLVSYDAGARRLVLK